MFVSRKDEDFASIMIKDGKFKDVIYNYGKVSIPEEDNLNDDGTLPFRFEYTIINLLGLNFKCIMNNPKFQALILSNQ